MADITNLNATLFTQEQVRPMAERVYGAFYGTIPDVLAEFTANIGPLIAGNAGSDPIIDKPAQAGHNTLTKTDLLNIGAILQLLQAIADNDSSGATTLLATVMALDVKTVLKKANVRSLADII